ncbi:hypothetical protein CAEBREN_30747 [Caenorhabditis brenneri]|uniref:Uncharacterized protein n=1 Tax=Caenorhabditis brenneri TaxID=135651 RepID=G0NW02_CAEBE|nr:hypothetical protein CAEBREN_30747 [Caenorhabditis brenneri]
MGARKTWGSAALETQVPRAPGAAHHLLADSLHLVFKLFKYFFFLFFYSFKMSSTANFIVSGVLADGTPIIFGAVPSDGTSHQAIHHVSSASHFQVESWDGEHAEHEHEHEEPRRFSIFLEEGGAEKTGLTQEVDDEEEPIASSKQFERTRSASLAAALLELDPRGVPLVQFFKLATNEPLLEVDEGEDEVEPSEAERVLSQLLFTLRSLKMSGGETKHSEAVQRLRELEEELRAAGAVTPADPAVSEAVARALAVAGAGRDVQIRVNQSKHTTTTKTVYETETSGMAHMDIDQIRKLQQDIIADISSGAEQHSGQDSGTTQKKETAEEGFTNEDGSVVVSKKMTRVVTTTRTTLPGEGEEPSAPDSPVESLGSVKDRIAKFEQFKTLPIDPSVSGPPPSVHSLPQETEEETETVQESIHTHEEIEQVSETQGRDSGRSDHSEQSIPEVQFTESDTEIEHHHGDEHHEESYLEPTVGIVITPHTPVPPEHPEDKEEYVEDEQPQEPLEPSEPEHVARAEIKDTREYSDEELAHELSPSEEHVSTAEIKDIKSYSPTSSDDERASQKGKVSPPIPQARHVISPSVASEVMSSHDDELAAHFVAESFEKQDEGSFEVMEQTPIYRGHHSPGQTSPIVSEHPLAQEYAESVTSHDEGDNLSLKSGHEVEIARHSVASVQEEEEEDNKPGLGDYAKKAGMIVGGVIAAPVALAAVGAKAAYDALKKDDEEDEEKPEGHEEKEVLTTQTTIMESPIQHEDIPAPHMEDVTPKVSHHEHPHEVVTETTTTVTREYYEQPEREASPASSSHVESERPVSPLEKEPSHVVTETTTTVTREYEPEHEEGAASPTRSEEESERHFVTETTTTTTLIKEYEQPEDSERLSEPAQSPEPVGTPADSEKYDPHVVETTTTTTVTREFYDDEDQPEPVHRETSPVESPIASERSIRSVQQQESPRHSPVPSEPISEKDAHHITETTTTTTVTREYYDEPQEVSHSPAPSSHQESEHAVPESPVISEKELPHVIETTTTTTTVTREFEEEPEHEPEHHQEISHHVEAPATRDVFEEEYPRPESPAEVYPIPSEKEQEHHLVSETTTTTTVTREYYDEPEQHEGAAHPDQELYKPSESPAQGSPVPSEKDQEHHFVKETTTTTTVTREFHDDEYDRPESPLDVIHKTGSPAPSTETEHRELESPAVSEKEVPHVTERTTTTTVTREYFDNDYDKPEFHPSDTERQAPELPVTQQFHQESEYPAAQYSHEETHVSHQQQPESGEESDGEGLGSKVLGFAKKAGMVAGGVVAAPVALAAVGAKAAYDALKKDDEEEGEEGEHRPLAESPVHEVRGHEEEEEEGHKDQPSHSPAPSADAESEHVVPDSPVVETTTTTSIQREYRNEEYQPSPDESPMEQQQPWATERTTTTTVTREFYDEPEEHHGETHSPAPSSHIESEHPVSKSPALSEKDYPTGVETTTTTTVTREYEQEPEAEHFEQRYDEPEFEERRSPSSAHSQEHLVKETTTTTTVTREFYDEPEHVQEHHEESFSPAPSSHVESEHQVPKSPALSEVEHPHVVETTTTTTVTREFHDDEYDRPESPLDVIHKTGSPVPSSEHEVEHRDLESPTVSEREVPHVTETTTTTTVTREYYDDEDQYRQELPVEQAELEQEHRSPSPVRSEEGSVKHFITETTTTTTVTKEYEHPEDSERLSETAESQEHELVGTPAESEKSIPHIVETTTTTTVTSEFYQEEEPTHHEGSAVHQPFAQEQEGEYPVSPRASPVPSEKLEHDDVPLVKETTTTTTVTREYEQEPEAEHFEHRYDEPEFEERRSLSPAHSQEHLVKETTTTTTVTREFYDEPEHDQEHQEVSLSPARSSHVESEHQVPESPAVSEKELPHVTGTSLTQDSPAAQYFHEEPEYHTESPVQTEKTPLFTEQQQPESGEESDGEGFGSKVLGFAKKAGMVAGGVVAAPVALAAVGAKAAYDALKKDDEEEDQDEQEALLGDVRERRAVDSPADIAATPEHLQKSPMSSEVHHVTETTTTTTVTREYFDEAESPVPSHEAHDQESVEGSQKSIPHVVETTTTTTVTRDFDEPSPAESPVPSEKEEPETTTTTREVFEAAEGDEPAHHFIETTTTTVKKDVFDEPEETLDDSEPKQEIPHVVETTTTTKTTREYDDEEEGSETGAPHVTETTTTTTVVREFYGETPEDQEHPDEEESAPAQIEQDDVSSPGSESTTSVSRGVYPDEPHVVETTTTTTITREYHDEPEESEDAEVKETTTTTTVTREYYEEEPESPIRKEQLEDDRTSPVESERSVPQEMEHDVVRDIHSELRQESPVGQQQEEQHRAASPTKSEEGSERHFISETTTTTTVTSEFEHPEHEFDSERLSEPTQSPEPVGTPAESEKSIPHVVETTTTTTVTREFYDDEEHPQPAARDELSPVLSEQQFDQKQQRDSTIAERGSPVPSEKFEHDEAQLVKETTTSTTVTREYEQQPEVEHFEQKYDEPEFEERRSPSPAHSQEHLVKETTTTTTVTREFYDEPEHVQEHQQESFSPSPSSHVESEKEVPESPAMSEKELPHVTRTSLTQDSPAAQYFHQEQEHYAESPVQTEKAPLLTEQQQPESGEESDGEGFGSKVLGFAKKAGMVAGGVVAAPVALAAVGAKAAYDALKKDDEEEDQDEQEALLGDVREQRSAESPIKSEAHHQFEESEQRFQESPYEETTRHTMETTITTVPQEFYEEPESPVKFQPAHAEDQESLKSPTVSEKEYHHNVAKVPSGDERDQSAPASPVHSHKDDITQFQDEQSPESVEKYTEEEQKEEAQPEFQRQGSYSPGYSPKSPRGSLAESDEGSHQVIETVTSTVTEKHFKQEEQPQEEQKVESPVPSEEGSTRFIETTTTTTTVTREHFESEDEQEPHHVVESQRYDGESPIPSDEGSSRVVETTTTTTVTQGHFEPEDEQDRVAKTSEYSPSGSPIPSEKSLERVVETTTTTAVTREYFEEEQAPSPVQSEEKFEGDRDHYSDEPAIAPYQQPTEYGRVDSHDAPASPAPSAESPIQRDVHGFEQERFDSERLSEPAQSPEPVATPAESEKSIPHVVETTTTTTVTSEFYDEEEQPEPARREESPVHSEQSEAKQQVPESPAEHVQEHQKESFSPAPTSHVESEHQAPESPAVSEKELPHVTRTSLTQDSPATQYFHEEQEHYTESPVQTEKAPLLTEQQQQPESGEESDGEGFGSKVLGFAKKAGMVAGGVVAAPVALAAVGAKAAYDALKKDDEEEDQDEQEALLGDVREQRSAGSPIKSEAYHQFEEPEQRFQESPYEVREQHDEPGEPRGLVSPVERRTLADQVSEEDTASEGPEPEYTSPVGSTSEQSQHYTEVVRKTTVTREYLDDDELQQPEGETRSRADSIKQTPESPSQEEPYVVETTTTVIRHYHDEPKTEEESEEKTLPEEVTVLREVYEAPEGDEPEHHYIETKTTTTITKEVYAPTEAAAPGSPVHSEKDASETDFPIRDTLIGETHPGDTVTTTVTREYYQEPEGVRPASGSEADDESHAPRYMETTTTTTVTCEYEVSEDDEEESHPEDKQHQFREGSPVPSEESVSHVVEKITTTTVTEERYEPEEGHSDEDIPESTTTTTTTTTVTREHFEPEGEHLVESHEYQSESPVPSEQDSHRYIEKTTTTTTVTHEHVEPEEDQEHLPIVESQVYSPSGSPTPSEKLEGHFIETTTTTTVTREHVHQEDDGSFTPGEHTKHHESDQPESKSPVPSEGETHDFIKTTTTTTTVTREHFEAEDEHPSEGHAAEIPSDDESGHVIETTTTTTVTKEHFEPEDHPEQHHVVESQECSPSGSPVPSEKSTGHVVETTTTTTALTREHFEPEEKEQARTIQDSPAAQYFHEEQEYHTESPVQTEKAPLLTEQQQPDSGEESDGEGFGSKVLGFAKKAGMVAGGVVAAPVALAAVGAKAAYDALKKDDEEEDQDEQEALLEDVRERRALDSPVDYSKTQQHAATFYEPEEEDKVVVPESKEEEPKIVFPVDTPADQYVKEKEAFESMVQAEGPYIIESEEYEATEHQEPRISSPVHSDSGDIQPIPQQEQEIVEEETPRPAETSEADAPYIIDSEEYEFTDREEPRISSPAHSDEEERQEAGMVGIGDYDAQQQNVEEEEDPNVVESEEYTGSGQGSPRPFEDFTTTTVLSVHHEPPAIPEPEVDEEEFEQDRSVIESGEYSQESPLPPTSVTSVEHVEPSEEHEHTATSPTTVTTVTSEHFEQEKDPYVVESEEYTRASPIGHERPESPSGSPTHDDSHVIESQEYSGSPVPSEDSVRHVVEKVTTVTTNEEHFEPEDSSEDVYDHVKTTTTTTTVTREHFEPEEEEHVVESREYESGSPVPSEKESSQVIETVTTTTVVREHFEPEDDQEEPHIVESQEYSPTGSPAPSDKHEPHLVETTTTTFETRERVEPEEERAPSPADSQRQPEIHSPVPSEEDVHGYIKTTTTTTTVTREHFEPEEEHVVESEKYPSGSPVPSEEDSNRGYETTTTTTVTREEHFEPEEEQHHIVESREYSPSGSPVPSEKSVGHVIETTTTTTVTREHVEPEQEYFHSESGRQSPVSSEKSAQRVIETSTLTTETRERFEPEEERQVSPLPSEEEVHGFVKTTSATTTESHVEPEHFQKEQESGEESDGEGFGSKVLGFAKKAGMVAGGVVAAPVALAAVGAKAAYDALKKDDEEEVEPVHYESADLQKPAPTIETHQEKDDSESEGSFVDHGEESQHLPLQSTEAAFKLSTEDVAEQTAEKLVSEVFSPLDRTLKESEEYRASMESLNRRSPVESKRSVEDLASEALQNVTKISFGHADDSDDKHDDHDEEWKVYDRHGEILEEFSTQLTDDVIQEAEGDATTQIMMTQAEYSPRRSKFLKQESCQEISNEPEVDYYSDLQEKLNILAGEKNNLHALVEEEPSSSASDQLDVIHESDQEAHLEQEHQKEADAQKEQEEKEEAAEYTATHLVDDILQQVVHEINEEDDDQKTMTSDAYLTATEKDDQEYDTCVTSQDDTYESAQGWTSQDSEYTTATSQAPSRLSDSDGEHTARDRDQERQETSTPQAILSPVDSDRHFTVQQDFDMPVIRAFDPDDFMQNTARSTPDVALQVTIEEEDESDDKLPISPSGILLPPSHDPGRPISPVPPRKSDGTMQKEGDHFVFVREEDTIAEPTPPPQPAEFVEEVRKTPEAEEEETRITRENVPQEEEETEMRRQETERIHSLAMEASSDLGNSESSRYSRQLSDLSSSAESHADTVIRVESERSGSSDSLEVVSVISAGKDVRTSEKSLTPEDQEKPLEAEKAQEEKEHPEEHHERPEQEAEDLGFEVYDADTEEQQQPVEELETVEEEPEDSDSLNEGGNHSSGHSSVGVPADTLAMIGKYRHQSSDNLSLTSLQEFERLEKEVGARGDGSLTRSEIELLVAGRLNRSGEGSVSSLAEFERLEKEMTENQSPPEDVMMLSDIREESEAEDMSIRDDDEEDVVGSDTELKSRPVQEEDLRVITPVAPSPTDSLEHAVDPIQMQYLETSTDSLEPTFQEIEVEQRPESVEDTSLTEYEMVPRVMEASTTDSLDGTATIERDSVLEGASQGIESTQSTHGLLSGDTMGTVVTDDDRDSLDGEVSSMLQSYPTTLTTFQTTVVGPDGSLQTISRRVETRVTDPLISHVTFTGTESQERLDQLPDDEQFETVDTEGNVTRTTFHREHDQQPHPHF